MKKYFLKYEIGAGMFGTELYEADTLEKAEEFARDLCIDMASSYGYYQDMDYFGEMDSVANEDSWDEDDQEYTDVGFLEYYAEEYNPEEHGDLL